MYHGQNLKFIIIIDTGLAVTIISRDVFNGLPGEKPALRVNELLDFKIASDE